MLVQVEFASGSRRYTYSAPEGTEIGDVLSLRPDGLGVELTVVEIGSDYDGEVAVLYERVDGEDGPDETDGEA
jgi:hypothetical protein